MPSSVQLPIRIDTDPNIINALLPIGTRTNPTKINFEVVSTDSSRPDVTDILDPTDIVWTIYKKNVSGNTTIWTPVKTWAKENNTDTPNDPETLPNAITDQLGSDTKWTFYLNFIAPATLPHSQLEVPIELPEVGDSDEYKLTAAYIKDEGAVVYFLQWVTHLQL